jgi:flagellar assembly factor FliW
MQICTMRFGTIDVEPDAVLFFEKGLIGFDDFRQWVLLADPENAAVGWLQSADQADVAMAVVSPRRFVPEYRVRLSRRQLQTIQLDESDEAYVLTVVGKNDHALTLNLRAPLLVNLQQRLGRQIITLDGQPLQYEFSLPAAAPRMAA